MRKTLALLAAMFLALPLSAGCGATANHARRGAYDFPPREPVLVQIVDSAPLEAQVISMTRYEIHPSDPLPAKVPDGVLIEMREEAARAGAESLLVERLETPWRKGFYGLGLRGAGAAPIRCDHPGYAEAVREAAVDIERCLRAVQKTRPALRAAVTILFQVGAFGTALRAAPTPDSSRDGQAQACGLEAVFKTDFGAPAGFVCRGRVNSATP